MENILERIQKLIALQEDAERQGSLAEAANAAAKVQDLLLKHNLDMAEVNGHKKVDVILKKLSCKEMGWNKRQGRWVPSLFNGICEFNFCNLVMAPGWDNEEIKLNLMGEPENVEVVEYMGYTLVQQLLKLEGAAWRSYRGPDKRGTFRRGYFQGAVLGVTSKLREQRNKAMEDNTGVSALVHVQSEKVEKFQEQEFPHLKKTRGTRTKAGEAAKQMGFQDGRNAQVNKGVGQHQNTQIHG